MRAIAPVLAKAGADPAPRSLHYIAGGNCYAIGESLNLS